MRKIPLLMPWQGGGPYLRNQIWRFESSHDPTRGDETVGQEWFEWKVPELKIANFLPAQLPFNVGAGLEPEFDIQDTGGATVRLDIMGFMVLVSWALDVITTHNLTNQNTIAGWDDYDPMEQNLMTNGWASINVDSQDYAADLTNFGEIYVKEDQSVAYCQFQNALVPASQAMIDAIKVLNPGGFGGGALKCTWRLDQA